MLQRAHDLGLFIPNAVIGPNGRAEVPSGHTPSEPTVKKLDDFRVDRDQTYTVVPNFSIKIPQTTSQAGYAREIVWSDVREDVNTTNFGMYSFRIFVDCVYSVKTLAASGGLPPGQRETLTVGSAKRKHPSAAAIAKTDSKKRRVSEKKENIPEPVNTRPCTRVSSSR
ncbi:hypothetical protein K438DRAFT_1962291 [Mycena galopus ATCC 62051]|nr:hypothetical protein K438DRAFT_1962291 [Mycena galopus ATCC 62051]